MNELKEQINIEKMIYEIRGKQVMLDRDLAKLYECKNGTKTINLAVKRNIERFPNDFYFQLTREEYNQTSRFQNETLNKNNNRQGYNLKYLPYVFTEQGVAMLATILKTSVATEVSIGIMRAFVAMRKYIGNNLLEQRFINELVIKDNKRIDLLETSFSKLEEKKKTNEIYFDGQIYDAYSKLLDIMIEAKKSLVIIDRYADKITLDMISRLKVEVILITKQNELLKELDIKKYQEQYHNLKIIYNDAFHDRYLIIDENKIYHCGASINHAGSRTFSINLLDDEIVKKLLLHKITELQQMYV